MKRKRRIEVRSFPGNLIGSRMDNVNYWLISTPSRGQEDLVSVFYILEIWSRLALERSVRQMKGRIADLKTTQRQSTKRQDAADDRIVVCSAYQRRCEQALEELRKRQSNFFRFEEESGFKIFLTTPGITQAELEPLLAQMLRERGDLQPGDEVVFEWYEGLTNNPWRWS